MTLKKKKDWFNENCKQDSLLLNFKPTLRVDYTMNKGRFFKILLDPKSMPCLETYWNWYGIDFGDCILDPWTASRVHKFKTFEGKLQYVQARFGKWKPLSALKLVLKANQELWKL